MGPLRLALRRLLHEPGFAFVAVLSLALGIGANTAVFSVVEGALLRPLDYPQPRQLVALHESIPQFAQRFPVIPVDTGSFAAWRQAKSFSALALFEPGTFDMTGVGPPLQVQVEDVSANMFRLLGVKPSLGRDFTAEEDQPKRNHVVILSHAFWRQQFHSDPGVLGQTIDLNGKPNQVIGVLPASFQFPYGDELGPLLSDQAGTPAQIFQPAGLDLAADPFDSWNYGVYGRLRPGVSATQARAELQVLTSAAMAKFAAQAHATAFQLSVLITPLRDQIVGQHSLGIWLLLAAVGAVLLIVCLNLANLLLVRVHARGHELAIRQALGASRPDLLREVVSEGVVLGLGGGALGVLGAWWAVRALVAAAPAGIPRIHEVALSAPVLAFAFGLALASGILFSLGPGLRAARSHPQGALRAGGRGASDTADRMRVRQALVAGQAALSALLLIVAGLLTASYMRLMHVDAGYQADQVLTVSTGWNAVPNMASLMHSGTAMQTILEKLRALPGVTAAGLIENLPLQGSTNTQVIGYVNDTRPFVERPLAEHRNVSPGYFSAMGIPLLRGRDLDDEDLAAAAKPHPASINAVISLSMAEKLWPGRDPLGQQFVTGGNQTNTVVGVVGDVRGDGLAQAPMPTFYPPFTSNVPMNPVFVLRARSAHPDSLAAAVRQAIWSAEPAVTVPTIESMDAVVAASTASRRFQLGLVLAFALCAVVLAGLGIYGVIAYTVERRKAEISLRLTLGASRGRLAGMVLRQGLAPVVVGLLAGIGAALAAGRLLASFLFDVRASDPAIMAGVGLLLLAVGALACALPAHRATNTDPAMVLRQ